MTSASGHERPVLRVSVASRVSAETLRALRNDQDLHLVGATPPADVVVAPAAEGDLSRLATIVPTPAALGEALAVGADTLGLANRVLTTLARAAGGASWPADVRLAAPPVPRLGTAPTVTQAVVAALGSPGARWVAVDAGSEAIQDHPGGVDAMVAAFTTPVSGGCAVSLAAAAGRPALTVAARAFEDAIACDIAAALASQPAIEAVWPLAGAGVVELVVFGAHLRGGALSHQLTDLGARWAGELTTAPRYRMTVLPTVPAKPAVVRVAEGESGAALHGQRWLMSAAALGRFLAALPPPMQLGKVEFDDGSWRTAFGCDGAAATGRDISAHGSWPAAVAAGAVSENGSAVASTTTPRSGR
ncbi:hypothetical protein ACCO42_03565 [Mycolicibacterium sp. D3]|uniref:allophanate hydrolase-related protein n=1 Tax=unclassified Mycobacterium TaxID=2642494 RepID=UPI001A8E5CEB|nr:allophanate hydrolase [Mycobacterium sp. PO2]